VITNGLNLLFTLLNHAPIINTASIAPDAPTRTNALFAVVTSATDPDGDSVSYVYQWQQSTNDSAFTDLAGQTDSTLSAALTVARNYYRVLITPNDGLTMASHSSLPPFRWQQIPMATELTTIGK